MLKSAFKTIKIKALSNVQARGVIFSATKTYSLTQKDGSEYLKALETTAKRDAQKKKLNRLRRIKRKIDKGIKVDGRIVRNIDARIKLQTKRVKVKDKKVRKASVPLRRKTQRDGKISIYGKVRKIKMPVISKITLTEFGKSMKENPAYRDSFNNILSAYNVFNFSHDFMEGGYGEWVERVMFAVGIDDETTSVDEFKAFIKKNNRDWF